MPKIYLFLLFPTHPRTHSISILLCLCFQYVWNASTSVNKKTNRKNYIAATNNNYKLPPPTTQEQNQAESHLLCVCIRCPTLDYQINKQSTPETPTATRTRTTTNTTTAATRSTISIQPILPPKIQSYCETRTNLPTKCELTPKNDVWHEVRKVFRQINDSKWIIISQS